MKLMQKACSIRLPNTNSANARSELILTLLPSSATSPVTPSTVFAEFFFAADDVLAGDLSVICIRNDAVRTNWPTAEQNPERKALNGYFPD